jgi:hypothetical protein
MQMINWSEFLATKPEVPGSISDAATFFGEAVILERNALSLVRITPLYLQKLALNSATSGDRSVGIISLLTKSHRVCFV